jgi:phage-related protein
VSPKDKPVVWLHGEIKTPPFSKVARIEAGFLLRQLQRGNSLGMPQSRPMPIVGQHCHELRVTDAGNNWRIIYRIDRDAIVILEVFPKKTKTTPREVIDTSSRRLKEYDNARKPSKKTRK